MIVRSAAAGQIEPFAADSIVSAYGANLAAGTSLNDAIVTVTDASGTARSALLYYVSPAQINFEIPDGTAIGPATITIGSANAPSQAASISIGSVSPGLFALNTSGLAAAWVLPLTGGVPQTLLSVNQAIDLGTPNQQVYLELYGTGIRHANTVSATVGGIGVPVLYAGPAPGFPGEDQVNIGPLPPALSGVGNAVILLTADAVAANLVQVNIQ
jgi:uncharacterized protein (TIGR03437 family)